MEGLSNSGFPERKKERKATVPNPPRLTPSDRNRSGPWNQGQHDTNTSGILHCCIHNCASDSNRTFFGSYLGFIVPFLFSGREIPAIQRSTTRWLAYGIWNLHPSSALVNTLG